MDKDKKNKVLHVVNSLKHGGIETFLMSMLQSYDRQRFNMDILYTGLVEGPYATQARGFGAEVVQCRMKKDQVRFIYKLYRFLRCRKYDSVNSHLSDLNGGVLLAALLANIPVRVASYHQMLPDMGFIRNLYLRIMRWFVVKTATGITTSSPAVTESYFARHPSVHGMIQPISYGVDTDFFSMKPDKALDLSKFGFLSDDMIVGHVGTYRYPKNHEALVKIARLVVNEVPNVRFLLCGRPVEQSYRDNISLYDKIGNQINELGLSKHFARVQDLEDMREFYQAIDVFVLPSRQEGMPVSIIEAQAAGKPVVASRIGGIILATAPEMRDNLFYADDMEAFAKCLIELLKNKDKMIRLGMAGRTYVRQNLDIKNAVKKYEKMYLPKKT